MMSRFSRPVSSSWMAVAWPARPMTSRTAAGERTTSRPSTRARPRSGSSRVVRILTAVVLPAPLGPRTPSTRPRSTPRSMPRSACTLPKDLWTPSTRMAGPSHRRPAPGELMPDSWGWGVPPASHATKGPSGGFRPPPSGARRDEVDELLDGADEVRLQVAVAADRREQAAPHRGGVADAEGRAHPLLPWPAAWHRRPLGDADHFGPHRLPDIHERCPPYEHVRPVDLRGDARLFRSRDEVVDQYSQAGVRAGRERCDVLRQAVDPVEALDDDALYAQVVAPDLLDELGVVDALDPDAAGARHTCPLPRHGARPRGGPRGPCRPGSSGAHEGHRPSIDLERTRRQAHQPLAPELGAHDDGVLLDPHDAAASPRRPVHDLHTGDCSHVG